MRYLILISIFVLSSCEKNPTPTDTNVENRYYVKYVIDGKSSSQQQSETGLKVTISNELGTVSDYIRSNRGVHEFVVGPVKKGFIANLKGTNICKPLSCYIRPNLQIFLSQNNEPYVLKIEDMSTELRDLAEIQYTIQ